jgi:hypothetical protein
MSYLNPIDAQKMYQELIAKGYDEKAAAKETQAKTGISTATWKPIKGKSQQLGSWDGEEVTFNGFGMT